MLHAVRRPVAAPAPHLARLGRLRSLLLLVQLLNGLNLLLQLHPPEIEGTLESAQISAADDPTVQLSLDINNNMAGMDTVCGL